MIRDGRRAALTTEPMVHRPRHNARKETGSISPSHLASLAAVAARDGEPCDTQAPEGLVDERTGARRLGEGRAGEGVDVSDRDAGGEGDLDSGDEA